MFSFIDIHHHLLYGLDDGPHSADEMRQMLITAQESGVRTILATPHIAPGIEPFPQELALERLEEAREICRRERLDLTLLPGAEMMYTYQSERYLAQRKVPTLASSSQILVEFAPDVRYDALADAVQTILRNGYTPVIAHIERYPALIQRPNLAVKLHHHHDVQYQVNCQTILKSGNYLQKWMLKKLFDKEMIDYIASDAHDVKTRACCMRQAYEKLLPLTGESYADRLTGNGIDLNNMLIG